ncbi:hypothetical protein TWF696_004674 [Orbilia brochopaga]|uniref:Uncharacterized protein n=1 Tax=Orbilia brochopaga TaxID=3140254 RepID=A0AAV9V7L7_9PEZI
MFLNSPTATSLCLRIQYATLDFIQDHGSVRANLTAIAFDVRKGHSKAIVLRLHLPPIIEELVSLRGVSVSGVNTIAQFRMLSAILRSIKGRDITKLVISFGTRVGCHRESDLSLCLCDPPEKEISAVLDDHNLEFPTGVQSLRLSFQEFASKAIDQVDVVRAAYSPSKDSIVELEPELCVFQRKPSVEKHPDNRLCLLPSQRFAQEGVDLASLTLKRLDFCCCSAGIRSLKRDMSFAILPLADIASLWPNIEVLEYCTGDYRTAHISCCPITYDTLVELRKLQNLRHIVLGSPWWFDTWTEDNCDALDVVMSISQFIRNLPSSVETAEFRARSHPDRSHFSDGPAFRIYCYRYPLETEWDKALRLDDIGFSVNAYLFPKKHTMPAPPVIQQQVASNPSARGVALKSMARGQRMRPMRSINRPLKMFFSLFFLFVLYSMVKY